MNFFYSEFFSCFNGKIIDGNFSKINDVFCGKEIVSYLKFTQFSRIFSRIITEETHPLKLP